MFKFNKALSCCGLVLGCGLVASGALAMDSVAGASGQPHNRAASYWKVFDNYVYFNGGASTSGQWDTFLQVPVSNFQYTSVHAYQNLESLLGYGCQSRFLTFTSTGAVYGWGTWTHTEDLGTLSVPPKGSAVVQTSASAPPSGLFSCKLKNVFFN